MAWAEAALEEMGLAQIWVRRGQRASGGAADDAAVAAQSEAAGAGAATVAAASDALPSWPAAAREAHEKAAEPVARRADDDASTGAPMRAAAPVADGDPVDTPRAPQPADDVPGALTAIASAEAASPSADMPPVADDDFAWFDAAPPGDSATAAEPRAAEAPVAMLDWDALAARVADCTRCRLCEKRTNTVFGVGDREADWMLIGEAPGENEDKQGEPFVGQAGKLLDNMLRSLSLQRGENVYIANVIKCRPPGNRNPEPDEVARCEPYLQRQVALVKPKLIVALGRFAAQTLLKTDASIASLRGRVHAYEGVPVIVTYHPAYLLRSLPDKAKAWADLCLARDTFAASPAPDAPPPAAP
ncbi:uracil-DNA glycosylase [Burkholderia multivorans]|uniref:uracil-DNA glycosylase n=1 Tax=Burkholderia multivorans TaxID=87883 RepID=UPI000D01B795|nr:uracil-DNA glycosylase [Burkholderia multivorans]PRH49922.1 uracil-DNA glycosylase [Burkholderia multivorans]